MQDSSDCTNRPTSSARNVQSHVTCAADAPNLSNCSGFSSSVSVCHVQVHAHAYIVLRPGTVLNPIVRLNPRARMSTSRTIRWVLLIAALAVAGYFGWQRFTATNTPRRLDRAEGARPANAGPRHDRTGREGRFSGLSDRARHRAGLQYRHWCAPASTARSTRSPSRKARSSSRATCWSQIDPRPFQAALDQAKAKKAQDEANLANAKLDLQRFTKLGEFATRQQTDTQRSTVAQLTAQIAADDAAISNAQTQLDYTTIKAPISGRRRACARSTSATSSMPRPRPAS